MKNIVIMTLGSRGDIQPYIALAVGLYRAGYSISVAAPKDFASMAMSYDIPFLPLDIDMHAITVSKDGTAAMKMSLKAMKKLWSMMMQQMQTSWNDCLQYAKGADLLICHPKILVAYDLAESLHIPLILAHPVPMLAPMKQIPFILCPNTYIGFLNRLSYSFNSLLVLPFKNKINIWRKKYLNLPARRAWPMRLGNKDIPILYGFSSHLFPQISSWPAHVYVTGAWTLPPITQTLPSGIQAFLKADHTPVICVTFSSMPMKKPQKFITYLEKALSRLHMRAIVLRGWSGIQKIACENIFFADQCDHTCLFPHVNAVIHHGGSGTIAATLKAGKPMIICPFTADQPFWARQMRRLGVCADIFTENTISIHKLSRSMHKVVNDKRFSQKAYKLGLILQKENGTENALRMIEKYVKGTS